MRITRPRAIRFLIIVLTPSILALVSALSLNMYVDPYWTFPMFGQRQGIPYCVADERLNKINKMVFGGARTKEVLLGSSRSTFFDTNYFDKKVFNLAVNGMRPVEYAPYLNIFIKYAGEPTDVYVGFDFFGYLYEDNDDAWITQANDKEKKSRSTGYRLNLMFDLGSLQKSIDTLESCNSPLTATQPHYRYDGVHLAARRSWNKELALEQLAYFAKLYSTTVDTDFRKRLTALKETAPHAKFHIYVPPLSAPLFRVLMDSKHAADYQTWLNILIEEFGSVTQFSGVNSFTQNQDNFYDAHHVYSDRTKIMIDIIQGKSPPHADGFGARLTKITPPSTEPGAR